MASHAGSQPQRAAGAAAALLLCLLLATPLAAAADPPPRGAEQFVAGDLTIAHWVSAEGGDTPGGVGVGDNGTLHLAVLFVERADNLTLVVASQDILFASDDGFVRNVTVEIPGEAGAWAHATRAIIVATGEGEYTVRVESPVQGEATGRATAAAEHGIGLIILQLFAIFVAAKIVGALGSLVKIPSVIGEILAGVILANTFLRPLLHLDGDLHFLEILAELGVVFLIFTVGLETPFDEMKRVGGVSLIVALLGVVVPFGAGYLLMASMGAPTLEGLFIGAALVATSVGITARVLADLGVIGRPEARIILGAAVIDDVLGLTILTIVQALAKPEGLDVMDIVQLVVQALLFVGALMYFGGRVVRRVLGGNNPLADRFEWASPRGNLFPLAMIVCLGLSALAATIGLAAIIGAFLAGMAFAAHEKRHDLVERFEGVTQFTVPFFFAFIGLQLNLAATASVLGFALVVTAIAVATKVIGCGIGALSLGKKSALAVGIGMMPRGEVGIIVALIGLSLHVIPAELYGVVVTMSLLTTIITPPALVWIFRQITRGERATPAAPAPGAP